MSVRNCDRMIIKGPAYIDGEIVTRYIGIDDGKISFVKRGIKSTENIFKWDGVILPAGTDMHVHFRDPGGTHKEDFYTGTLSAVHGGITTVVDMPNNDPLIDSLKRLKNKIDSCSKKACIDFGLYGMLSRDVKNMLEETNLFKVFLAGTTGTGKAQNLKKEAKIVLDSEGLVAFHCEDEDMFNEPGDDLEGYNNERSVESEVHAIKSLNGWPDGKKHVCHISTLEGLRTAKTLDLSVEATPHHLFFSDEVMLGPFGKVNPPLRGDIDHFTLWEHLERGFFDIMASDHAPHLESEKNVSFSDAPAGLPGVETMYPLMINSVAMGKIGLSTVVDLICTNPARMLGIKKGKIQKGYHADLAFFDFRELEPVMAERLHSKCGWSPYEGFSCIYPRHVISRGEFLVTDRKFTGSKGRGKYLKNL
ncbi:MAG: dihydroorotase [Thermoplasmata archaeon]